MTNSTGDGYITSEDCRVTLQAAMLSSEAVDTIMARVGKVGYLCSIRICMHTHQPPKSLVGHGALYFKAVFVFVPSMLGLVTT